MPEGLLIVFTRLVAKLLEEPENEFVHLWKRPVEDNWWMPVSRAGRQLLIIHCHDYPSGDDGAATKATQDFARAIEEANVVPGPHVGAVGVAIHTGSNSVRNAVAGAAESLKPVFVKMYHNGRTLFSDLAPQASGGENYQAAFDKVWLIVESSALTSYNKLGAARHRLTKALGPFVQDLKTWELAGFDSDMARAFTAEQNGVEIEVTLLTLVYGRDPEGILPILTEAAEKFPSCKKDLATIAQGLQRLIPYQKNSPFPSDVARLVRAARDADVLTTWKESDRADLAAHVKAVLEWWSQIQIQLDEASVVFAESVERSRRSVGAAR